ncbi:MAG: alpha/beta fold hydrolase [Acidimicrobiales bacterium]
MTAAGSSLPAPARPVVLVHGAFHGAWCWAGLQAELDRRGVPSFAVDLPGHGVSTEPLTDLHGDAEAVTRVLERMGVDDIVLVGHSYGGAVISQADLGGQVSRLVYLAAIVPDAGEDPAAVMAAFPDPPRRAGSGSGGSGGGSGPLFVRQPDGTLGADPALGPSVFYNTCTPAQTAAALARLCPQRAATFKQPLTRANWRSVPSTYVKCLQDKAVPPAAQDQQAERCSELVSIDSDHSPFLCAPSTLADLLVPLALRHS